MFKLAAGVVFAVALFAADPVVIDNDIVHIHTAIDMPHNKSGLHKHEYNRVMIYLNGGALEVIRQDGTIDEQHWMAGQVAWSPASGMHTSENVGTEALRILEVELKKPAPAKAVKRNPKADPAEIDPTHTSVLFENPQVRVLRSWREPGGVEAMHEHTGSGRATVMLTDYSQTVTTGDGKTAKLQGKAGDVMWSSPGTHSTVNNGPGRIEVIVVEVK